MVRFRPCLFVGSDEALSAIDRPEVCIVGSSLCVGGRQPEVSPLSPGSISARLSPERLEDGATVEHLRGCHLR